MSEETSEGQNTAKEYSSPNPGEENPSPLFAIGSLLFGIISIPAFGFLLFGIAAIILGLVALIGAKTGRASGRRMAQAGILLGTASLAVLGAFFAWGLFGMEYSLAQIAGTLVFAIAIIGVVIFIVVRSLI